MRYLHLALLSFAVGCPATTDKVVGDDTSPADDTSSTPEVVSDACDTDNESCAPHTCGGEGSRMLPGSDCLSCHSAGSGENEAPAWTIAGTAFSDIDGTSGLSGAVVRITDADGAVIELTTNAVGNFYTLQAVAMPYSAEIEVDGTTRAMASGQDYGGCNSCHSCYGDAAGKLRP